jgi:adenylate cyclase
MPRLVARGPKGEEKRRRLRPERPVRLGRHPIPAESGVEFFEVPWEAKLSRNHADVRWGRGKLVVSRLTDAKNPLFFKGEERDSFEMELGEHFVVGETTFTLTEDRVSIASDDPTPLEVVGYTIAEIRETRYRDADERIEVLATLPNVIRRATTDEELFSRLVLLLFDAIPSADAAAIVGVSGEPRSVEVFFWDSRQATTSGFKPSRRLILDAVDHHRHSVRSLWGTSSMEGAEDPDYTMAESFDWAFCTPVPGEACAGWGLYVAGKAGDARVDLRPDMKFTELVADLLGAMRDFQALQHQQATLGRFFSPVTLPILASAEGEKALAPRQTEVTILFCDLRGFSREAERSRDDLMGLLRRVSRALDVMTKCIHSHSGVIGDFQGDAALAFWGWPIDDPASALEACRAAVEIRRRFATAAENPSDPLAGFRCGIGIATGEAVAGRLGTAGQFKIDVFGPVVNLASRLEGITKQLRVPILVDENTVARIRERGEDPEGYDRTELRFRRLARLRPYGMEQALTVSELLPKSGESKLLDEAGVELYERALDAFIAGKWDEAFALLHEVPPWDYGKDFLTTHILTHRREPPPDWDGIVDLESK